MANEFDKLVTRSDKVAFMKVGEEWLRMQYFTSMSKSHNPIEYSRSYVDQPSEVTDVTGYSPSVDFAFDAYIGNKVIDNLIEIFDDGKRGSDAIREIATVDMTKKDQQGKCPAFVRPYSVIPDAEGDGTEAYTYSGTFRSNGEQRKALATVDADGLKCEIEEVTGGEKFIEEPTARRRI